MQKNRLIEKHMSLLFEEIPISPKLELYRANQNQIRSQRPRLHMNRLFLGRIARGVVNQYQIFDFGTFFEIVK